MLDFKKRNDILVDESISLSNLREITMATTQTTKKESGDLRIHKTLKKKLACLAEATGRSQTFLAEEAIEQYCELQSRQIDAINQGLNAAKDGRFISHENIKKKWESKRENLI